MKMSSPKDHSFPKLSIIAFSSDCKRSTLVHLSLLLTALFLAASSLFYCVAAQEDRHQHRRSSHIVSHGALSDEEALYIKNRQLLYYRDEFDDRGELALKHAILSNPLNITGNWVRSNVCKYTAVFCTKAFDNSTIRTVAGIDLNHGDIARYLPEELGLLTDLALFHINSNKFCGNCSSHHTRRQQFLLVPVLLIRPLPNRCLGWALLHRQFLRQRCHPSSREGDSAAPGDRSAEDREEEQARSLQDAFDLAIRSHDYGSHYQGVYSVKCNQDRFVVEEIVKFGSPFRFRLEVGSKPELLLAMSCLCKGNPDALLICNGFKDLEYISLALYTRKLTVVVLEQEEELDLVVDLSRKLGDRNGIDGSRTKYASSSERCRLAMVVFVVDGLAIPIADELAAESTESEAQEWPAASTVTQPRQLLLPQTAFSVLLLLPPPPSLASQLPPTSKTAVKRLADREALP
ncbi:hypothetical protein ACFXTO_027604 [Malus domestica]